MSKITVIMQAFTAYVGIDWADKHNINILLVKKNTAPLLFVAVFFR
jgi:hypothetical protein